MIPITIKNERYWQGGHALGAHGSNAAANNAAPVHERPLLARYEPRRDREHHPNQLCHQRPHLIMNNHTPQTLLCGSLRSALSFLCTQLLDGRVNSVSLLSC